MVVGGKGVRVEPGCRAGSGAADADPLSLGFPTGPRVWELHWVVDRGGFDIYEDFPDLNSVLWEPRKGNVGPLPVPQQ